MKLLNVSKFALGFAHQSDLGMTEALDRAMNTRLARVVDLATIALASLDYSNAPEQAKAFFWWYCDDYVELVKGRAHGTGASATSAHCALAESLSVIQRIFAPFLLIAAEESWSRWQAVSVRLAPWPDAFLLDLLAGPGVINDTSNVVSDILREIRRTKVLREIRRTKSEAKVSMKAVVDDVIVSDWAERLAIPRLAEHDLSEMGQVKRFETAFAESFGFSVMLAQKARVRRRVCVTGL